MSHSNEAELQIAQNYASQSTYIYIHTTITITTMKMDFVLSIFSFSLHFPCSLVLIHGHHSLCLPLRFKNVFYANNKRIDENGLHGKTG